MLISVYANKTEPSSSNLLYPIQLRISYVVSFHILTSRAQSGPFPDPELHDATMIRLSDTPVYRWANTSPLQVSSDSCVS